MVRYESEMVERRKISTPTTPEKTISTSTAASCSSILLSSPPISCPMSVGEVSGSGAMTNTNSPSPVKSVVMRRNAMAPRAGTAISVGRGIRSPVPYSAYGPRRGSLQLQHQQSGGPRQPLVSGYRQSAATSPNARPPTSLDIMHPSRRMSLLSQMSPPSEKSAYTSQPGTPHRESPEKSAAPNHPRQRMTVFGSGGKSPTKPRSISISEGVPNYKPKPLSRQTHPQTRILLSPQYAQQNNNPWNNLLSSSPNGPGSGGNGGVIGISDSDSESSGTDLECLESAPRHHSILNISSDEETSSDIADNQEESSLPSYTPILIDVRRNDGLCEGDTRVTDTDINVGAMLGTTLTPVVDVISAPPKTFVIPSDDEGSSSTCDDLLRRSSTETTTTTTKDGSGGDKNIPETPTTLSISSNKKAEKVKSPRPGARDRPTRRTNKLDKLTEHFNLLDFKINVINLGVGVVGRMNEACKGKENWKAKENLVRARIPEYDITRLGVRRSHRLKSKSSGYTLRRFLKKRDHYDHNSFDRQDKVHIANVSVLSNFKPIEKI